MAVKAQTQTVAMRQSSVKTLQQVIAPIGQILLFVVSSSLLLSLIVVLLAALLSAGQPTLLRQVLTVLPLVIIDGLVLGFLYATVALGYTMVYGVLEFINFAHGEIYMVGAFVGGGLGLFLTSRGMMASMPAIAFVILALVLAMAFSGLLAWGQREKKWPDLAYHFLIAPDGRIFEGRDIAYEGETNTKYPLRDQVQVELMGDFGRQRVSPKQLDSLVKLTSWLCAEYSIDPIRMGGHNERAPRQTSCPGADLFRYIEDGQLTKWVSAILKGQRVEVKERPALPEGPTIYVGDPAGDPPATAPAK